MSVTILIGLQWGDEGKGKMVDLLSKTHTHVVRSHGGANAGHTLVVAGKEYKFHLVPSGILYPHTQCYLAGGIVVDPEVLIQELDDLKKADIDFQNRFFISSRAHLLMPYHKMIDRMQEQKRGGSQIGTTGKGIGPCYTDKVSRIGITMEEFADPSLFHHRLKIRYRLLDPAIQEAVAFEDLEDLAFSWRKELAHYIVDVEHRLSEKVYSQEPILIEGAHGTMLDISYGTYPFVTSSGCIASSVVASAGLGPKSVKRVCGVVKAYTTRVGSGPLPSALTEEEQSLFMSHHEAREIGTTTGRLRRMGWFDVPLVRRSIELSGVDDLVLTKLDILDGLESIKICTHYEYEGRRYDLFPTDTQLLEKVKPVFITLQGWQTETSEIKDFKELPKAAIEYVHTLQALLKTPIKTIFVGPDRQQTLTCS